MKIKKSNEIATQGNTAAQDELQGIRVAAAMNLCNASVSQILKYRDRVILEQEYTTILYNLKLEKMVKDDELLRTWMLVLDTIKHMLLQETEKAFLEREYQHKLKNAIWSAIPSPYVILSGGEPISKALNLAVQIGTGYMNYRKSKSEYILENQKQKWELKKSEIDQLHALYLRVFETQWKLSEKYMFNDSYRLTQPQLEAFAEILSDPDPIRRYEKLREFSKYCKAFPICWYYMGNTARENYENSKPVNIEKADKYRAYAIAAYNEFENINEKCDFLREDSIAAMCALEQITLLDAHNDIEKINMLLDKAMGYAENNLNILQFCVIICSLINNEAMEEKLLKRLVNENYNLEFNGILLTGLYIKKKDCESHSELEDRLGKNEWCCLPWASTCEDAEQHYIQKLKNSNGAFFIERLNKVLVKHAKQLYNTIYYNSKEYRKKVCCCLMKKIRLNG